MSKFKLSIISFLLVVISVGVYVYYKYTNVTDYQKNIETYAEFLKKEPDNCFYNEQMAANYQALNSLDKAIEYYQIAIRHCPDHLINIFQLGTCYYVKGDKGLGTKYMNEAIEKAKLANNKELVSMFMKEKAGWLSQ